MMYTHAKSERHCSYFISSPLKIWKIQAMESHKNEASGWGGNGLGDIHPGRVDEYYYIGQHEGWVGLMGHSANDWIEMTGRITKRIFHSHLTQSLIK